MITPSKYFDVTNNALEYTAGRLAKRAWRWEKGWYWNGRNLAEFWQFFFCHFLMEFWKMLEVNDHWFGWREKLADPILFHVMSCYFWAWKLTCFPWLSCRFSSKSILQAYWCPRWMWASASGRHCEMEIRSDWWHHQVGWICRGILVKQGRSSGCQAVYQSWSKHTLKKPWYKLCYQ